MPQPYIPYAIKPYSTTLKPFEPPDIDHIDDEPVVCLEISQKLIPYILGLLEAYRWLDAFKGTYEDKLRAVGLFSDLMAYLAEADNTCMKFRLRQSPTNKCILEQSFDGGLTWSNAFDYSLCGKLPRYSRVSDGLVELSDDGETWEVNKDDTRFIEGGGTIFTNLPDNYPPPGQDRKCTAARRIVRAMQELRDAFVTNANNVSALSAILSAVAGATGIGAKVALISGVISALIGLTSSYFSSLLGLDHQKILICKIMCALEDDGSITSGNYHKLVGEVGTHTGFSMSDALVYRTWIQYLGPVGMTNAGRIFPECEQVCDECPECDTCDFIMDFRNGFDGVRIFKGYWQPGTGIKGDATDDTQTLINIRVHHRACAGGVYWFDVAVEPNGHPHHSRGIYVMGTGVKPGQFWLSPIFNHHSGFAQRDHPYMYFDVPYPYNQDEVFSTYIRFEGRNNAIILKRFGHSSSVTTPPTGW